MPLTVIHNAREVQLPHLQNGLHWAPVLGNGDKDAPMHCGFLSVGGGEPNAFLTPCDSFFITLKGEIVIEDAAKPGAVTVKAGDIVRILKGTTFKYGSPTEGEAFYVSQVPHDVDAKKHVTELF